MSLDHFVHAIPVLLTVWAAIVACFVALLTYRAQLTRYEDDQLFLNEQNPDAERLQQDIVRRVNRMQPLVKVFGGAASLITASIVAIWVADAIRVLQ